jgi:hypothetical protein
MNASLLLFNARSQPLTFSSSPRVDNGSGNVLFLLGDTEVYNFSLGNDNNYQMDLIAANLPLPNPDSFIKETRDLGLPEMMGFVTACLGVLLAVYLIKTWKQ